ncbi:YodC family protein [Paraburkholderia sp. J94]|uniref:YodC family protein n=1 Tax=Paraburkholderia sp. J94 TaxID=2805441 RepID=UPI002AB0BAEE|nr:YodC family protein [Paraburkholderia sp. J94]
MLDTTLELALVESLPAIQSGIGDVVTLKSGGPRMTVMYAGPVGFANGHWLICQWFDEQGELRQDMFAQDMVRIEPRSIPAGSVKLRMPAARVANHR